MKGKSTNPIAVPVETMTVISSKQNPAVLQRHNTFIILFDDVVPLSIDSTLYVWPISFNIFSALHYHTLTRLGL